jgi:hypothetical protein
MYIPEQITIHSYAGATMYKIHDIKYTELNKNYLHPNMIFADK